MKKTVISWTQYILDICLVLSFQVLTMPSKYTKFQNLGPFYTPFVRPSRDGPYYVIGYGGRAGVHTGFRTITLVLYIGYLPNLATGFPCGRRRTLFILGSLPLYRLIIYIHLFCDAHISCLEIK
jgi:hypothetical protein